MSPITQLRAVSFLPVLQSLLPIFLYTAYLRPLLMHAHAYGPRTRRHLANRCPSSTDSLSYWPAPGMHAGAVKWSS
ncbi:hypothetical protein C8R44DRAFT_778266 [Mycena epipterygia]|nr:hypothetical protein C8R44DRAFT_778266 [Mycena epipterygia]